MASVDVDDTMQDTDFSEAVSLAQREKVMQRLQDDRKAEDLKQCWQELPGIENARTVCELFAVYEEANGVMTIQALKEVLKKLGCRHLLVEIQELRCRSTRPLLLRESGIKKDGETVRKSTSPPEVCPEHLKKFKHTSNSKKPIDVYKTTRQEQRKEDAQKYPMQYLGLPAPSQVCQIESKETEIREDKKKERYTRQGLGSNSQPAASIQSAPVLAPADLVAVNTFDGMSSGQFVLPEDVASSDENSGTTLTSKLQKNQLGSDPEAFVRPGTSSQMGNIHVSTRPSCLVPSASNNTDDWGSRNSIDDGAESLAKHALPNSQDSNEDDAFSSSDEERVQSDDVQRVPSDDEAVLLMADRSNARIPVTTESDSSGAENPAIVTGHMPSEHMDYTSALQGLVDNLTKKVKEQERTICFYAQRSQELTEENLSLHRSVQQLEENLANAHQTRENQGEQLRQVMERCQLLQNLETVNVSLRERCSNLEDAMERLTYEHTQELQELQDQCARNRQELRDLNDVIPTLVNNVVLANQQRQNAETELAERTQEMDALMKTGMAASETDRVKLERERRKAAESMKRRFCYLACLVCLIFSVFLAWLSLEPD